jgi:hypothetical protein
MMFSQESLMVVSLFVVRLGVPVAITLLLIWGFRQIDRRWLGTSKTVVPAPLVGLTANAETGECNPALGPCWEFKACPEAKREKCVVYQTKAERCWLCHLQTDGRVPGQCRTCGLFAATTLAPAPVRAR